MIKRLTFILSALVTTLTAWCQVTISGTVISHDDGSLMPGVNVLEKGTSNGTVTDAYGNFSIRVQNTESILQVHFVGYLAQEVPLNGQQDFRISLKRDCIRDYFDMQRIGVYLNSGVIRDPAGGKLEIAFPAYFGRGTLTSSVSYQTDFHKNEFANGDLRLRHFVFSCDFDMDAGWYYRRIDFSNTIFSTGNSFEMTLNKNRFGIIAGYSHLNFNNHELSDRHFYNGPVLGLRTWVHGPLRLTISGKTAIYRNKQEYFGEASRDSRYVDVFVRYYKVGVFSELSLGVGITFNYRFKNQKKVRFGADR